MEPLIISLVLGSVGILGAFFLISNSSAEKSEPEQLEKPAEPPEDKPVITVINRTSDIGGSSFREQLSPVQMREGRRLRRKRKAGLYAEGEDIWDDDLYEDCYELLDEAVFEDEDLFPEEEEAVVETSVGISSDTSADSEPYPDTIPDTPNAIIASQDEFNVDAAFDAITQPSMPAFSPAVSSAPEIPAAPPAQVYEPEPEEDYGSSYDEESSYDDDDDD